MGAYLGQNNTLSVREREFQQNELGVDPVTIVTTGSALFKPAKKLFKNIFGGSGSDVCRDRQKQIADAIRTYLKPSDIDYLVSISGSSGVTRDPNRLAYHAVGGHDCDLSTYAPPGINRFVSELERLINERMQESQQQKPPVAASAAQLPAQRTQEEAKQGNTMLFVLIGTGIVAVTGIGFYAYRTSKKD